MNDYEKLRHRITELEVSPDRDDRYDELVALWMELDRLYPLEA